MQIKRRGSDQIEPAAGHVDPRQLAASRNRQGTGASLDKPPVPGELPRKRQVKRLGVDRRNDRTRSDQRHRIGKVQPRRERL